MADKNPPPGQPHLPLLIQYLFPASPETAWQAASERLQVWCRAFDQWMAERDAMYAKRTQSQTKHSWRRLLGERKVMPWALDTAQIEAHLEWMRAQGCQDWKMDVTLSHVTGFFTWCLERQVDPELRENPAASIPRPRSQPSPERVLLCKREVQALLGMLRRDPTVMGKRDYAFFLSRMRTGTRLKRLQQMQWKDFEAFPLLQDGKEAILEYLEASGRLAGMQPEEFIFAPLKVTGVEQPNNRREDWSNERYVSNWSLLSRLKRCGGRVGIATEQLELERLMHTAIRLRMEAGDSLQEMRWFMESTLSDRNLRYKLKKLQELPESDGAGVVEAEPLSRVQSRVRPGNRRAMKHGWYAKTLPLEAVQAIVDERVEGIQDELVGLRALSRGLLRLQEHARDSKEQARLMDAYTLAALRMAGLVEGEKEVAEIIAPMQRLDNALRQALKGVREEIGPGGPQEEPGREPGEPNDAPDGAGLPDRPLPDFVDPNSPGDSPRKPGGPGAETHSLQEEIAGVRLVMRSAFDLAMQALQETSLDVRCYLNMVDVYSLACTRLVNLLKRSARLEKGDFNSGLEAALEQALREVNEELRGEP